MEYNDDAEQNLYKKGKQMATHTVTTSKSWFQRLGNSFGGIIFGILLFIAGTILLWWNEGNFVKTQTALKEAQGVTQELGDIGSIDSTLNGQLVHATGEAKTDDILEDSFFGISTNAIRFERSVEYYQWVEDSKKETKQKLGGGEETVTTYTYDRKEWVASPIDSSRFASPEARETHKNTVIANVENFKVQAKNVAFGAYRLPDFLVSSIGGSESLTVELSEEVLTKLNQQIAPSDMVTAALPGAETPRQPSSEAPAQRSLFDTEEEQVVAPPSPLPQFVHVSGNTVYLGQSPAQPNIGDVRVTFKYTKPSNTVSLIAKLNGDTFESYVAKNGKKIGMLSVGTHSAENMFESAHAANSMWTWILRFVGVLLVCMSIGMMLAPLSVLASVVPFLGKLVGIGTGLVSMLFGLAWSLLIIALAWLFYRPLIGAILLAAAVGLVVLLFRKLRSGTEAKTPNLTA